MIGRRGLLSGALASIVAPAPEPDRYMFQLPSFQFPDGDVSWHLRSGYARLRLMRQFSLSFDPYIIRVRATFDR